MADTKKILISLPESLLNEVDLVASVDKKNRSELVREAMKHYLKERKKLELREMLKRGYQEMAEINQAFCQESLSIDNELLSLYENNLRSWK